ncbi:HisA/HisF-related TIM barrel protein [Streptomyces rimosus]|uniref:HisA/HisF-related TIM barrel protein n=1 Tax=Streptomyces rimosus TaxID=1927 RepID=UPI0004C9AD4D|nr:HisA/HisF-related TIM barrel protein [Streptomyces rimosus]
MNQPDLPVFRDQRSHVGDLVIPCVDVAAGRATEPCRIPGVEDPSDVAAIARAYAAGHAQKVFLDVFDPWDTVDYLVPLLRRIKRTGMRVLVSVEHGKLPSVVHAGGLLEAGADVLSVSTGLIEQPGTVEAAVREFGAERLMGVVNCRRTGPGRWEAYTHDGTEAAGAGAVEVARRFAELKVGAVLANSVDREGTGQGFDLDLFHALATASGLPVIASGGCGTLDHLHEALAAGDATYVLVNNMLHKAQHSIEEVRDHLLAHSSFGRE